MRAVVISGASRSLGSACVDVALERGARVLALARSFPPTQHATAQVAPDRLVLRSADLSRPDGLPTAAELAAFLAGADDVLLLNNAATIEPIGAVGRLNAAPLTAAVATNLTGTVVLTNAFLGALHTGDGPTVELGSQRCSVRILYITSSVARRPKPGTSVYCATKAGGEMFFAALRLELAHDPRHVVEVVDPGGMDTAMHAELRTCDGVYFPDQERLRTIAAERRLAAPQLVARRILDVHLP